MFDAVASYLSSFFTDPSGGCSKLVPPPRRNVQKESKELEQFNAALAAALEKLAQQQAAPAPQAAPAQQDDPAPQAALDQQADPTAQDDPDASS